MIFCTFVNSASMKLPVSSIYIILYVDHVLRVLTLLVEPFSERVTLYAKDFTLILSPRFFRAL